MKPIIRIAALCAGLFSLAACIPPTGGGPAPFHPACPDCGSPPLDSTGPAG